MALPTLSLDDRTFDQLFAFMRKQIDTGDWVDHNLSDPGIAQLDLLCWVGEMILYRTDRVPDAHVDRFAALIMDPPEPVTVPLTVTATHNAEVVVPAGTRIATEFVPATPTRPAHRFIFETIAPLRFRALSTAPPFVQSLPVRVRELTVVTNEALGTSNGLPNQTFPLRPVHADLGIAAGAPAPVLTDFVHRSPTYDPNPSVTVGGVAWELKRFLMTDDSRIQPPLAPPPKQHFMVDAQGAIRFGDDTFGSIPPAGAAIVCTRYQLLRGPDALIAANTPVVLLDPVAGLTINSMTAASAEGGDFFFRPDERIREGLKRFRRPYRLITSSDFAQVLRFDFNEFQQRAHAPERILRAIALMNRKPATPALQSPGHVTVTVLAAASASPLTGAALDAALTDPALADAQKQALIALPASLSDKIERFLDSRRLITTRVHLQVPPLTFVSISAIVIVARDRNTAEMTTVIGQRLRAFLGITQGGFDGRGWPLGGGVYRSKLFRLLEDIDGVDHVESLVLSPADAHGDVTVPPLSLPALAFGGLSISVARA